MDDELEAGLRERDRRFVVGIAIRVIVVLALGAWAWSLLGDARVGNCAARGFGDVTESPPRQ